MLGRFATVAAWVALVSLPLAAQERNRLDCGTGVRALAYSPDGKILAVATGDPSKIRLLDADKLTETESWTEEHRVGGLRFLADGKSLAIAHSGGLKVRVLASKEDKALYSEGPGELLELSPDGKTLAVATRNSLILFDVETASEKMTFAVETGRVTGIAFSADGKLVAAGNRAKTVDVWEVESGNSVGQYAIEGTSCSSVAFAPDGKSFFVGVGNSLQKWEISSGKWTELWNSRGAWEMTGLRFSPDGKTIAAGGGELFLVDAASGKQLAHLKGHPNRLTALAFSPDGKSLASGDEGRLLIVWNAVPPKPGSILAGHTAAIQAVACSPDGKSAASAGEDFTIRLWDLAAMKETGVLKGHEGTILSIAFSPDGKRLASTGQDKSVRIWDVAEKKQLHVAGKEGARHKDEVYSLAFSPDGQTVASGSKDGSIMLWNPTTGERRARWKKEGHEFLSVVFTPDGSKLVAGVQLPGASSWCVALWDVAGGKETESFDVGGGGISSMSLSPDGKDLLVGGSSGMLCAWNLDSRKEGTRFGRQMGSFGVAYSPDGKMVAGCGKYGVILWDSKGVGKAAFEGHEGNVNALAFTPDGRRLVTGSADKTVRVWELP